MKSVNNRCHIKIISQAFHQLIVYGMHTCYICACIPTEAIRKPNSLTLYVNMTVAYYVTRLYIGVLH